MIRRFSIAVAVALASVVAATAHAQPPAVREIGLLPGDLSTAPAVTNQVESHSARGGDQILVVWTDHRGTATGGEQSGMDILGIRLNAAGIPIDPAPFTISANAGWQQGPQATWNGTNWLVTFYSQDPTEFYYQNNIRGVRVSPAGQVLDAIPLLLVDNEQWVRVSGQSGQWLVTWYEPHPDLYGMDLVGRRLDGNGQFLDSDPVTLMEWTYPGAGSRVLAANGEYLVIGQDFFSYSYRARRVGFNGHPIGSVYTPIGPDIGSNGIQYLATWVTEAATYKLLCSRMSPDGVLTNPAGVQMSSGSFVPMDISITDDGTNWFVGWATDQKRVARVNASGQVLDAGGVRVPVGTPATQATYSFLVVGNATGGALTVYNDYRDGDANVFAIPLSAANKPGGESTVSTGTSNQRAPAFAAGPSGQIALAFISEASGNERILIHFLASTGQPTTSEPLLVAQGPALGKPGIAWNGSSYLIVWNDGSVKARRMRPDGTFVDASPIDVMPGFDVDVAALGQNFCVIASRVEPNPQYIDVYYRRVDGTSGALLDGAPVLVGGSYSYNARIHADGDRWLAIWERHPTHDDPQSSAQYSFINADGTHTPEAGVNSPFTSSGGQPDVATSGAHRLFVWRSNSLSNANNYIRGQIMNADGSWATGMFTIAEEAGRQLCPVVAWDGTNFLVVWEDQRNQKSFFDQRTDIYGARVSETGAVLDPAGFPVSAAVQGDATPGILGRFDEYPLVASTRFLPAPQFDSYRIVLSWIGGSPLSVPAAPAGALALVSAPNPFHALTEIAYVLPRSGHVRLAVHDVQGRLVRTLVAGETKAAGPHTVAWNGRDENAARVAPGVYLVVLRTADAARSWCVVMLN